MVKAWGRILAPVPDEALPECYRRAMDLHASSNQRTFPMPATLMLAAWEGMAARRDTIALCNRPEPALPPAPAADPEPETEPDKPCRRHVAWATLRRDGAPLPSGVICQDCGALL